GREIHQVAGMNLVLEAGAEITLQAGGSFIKIDPAGITLSGAAIRMNSGGSPGSGSGQQASPPERPREISPPSFNRVPSTGGRSDGDTEQPEAAPLGDRAILLDVTSGERDGQQARLHDGQGPETGGSE
ncbi:hypothetical protein DFR31_2751, partial [Alkalispirillum mobile]